MQVVNGIQLNVSLHNNSTAYVVMLQDTRSYVSDEIAVGIL
jgi:hypothetical protein